MPLEENLVLPRTVALSLIEGSTEPMEISSNENIETRRFELTLYTLFRGDINDVIEVFYKGLHSTGDRYDFPTGDLDNTVVEGKIYWDNFLVEHKQQLELNGRTIYSASIQFDAITTEEA